MNGKRIAWLGLLAAVGFGCQVSSADGVAEPIAEAPEELFNSSPGGVYCGYHRCEVDEVCCNEGCGTCAQPGVSCDRGACMQPPECSKDADCAPEADYCVGCDCVAVSQDERIAECPGPGVSCLADPCLKKRAVCQNQRCIIE